MQALLISNSGRPFLRHCREMMAEFVAGRRLGFVSAAAYGSEADYYNTVQAALSPLDIEVTHIQTESSPLASLERVEALFVGGGNSFRLLSRLRQADLLIAIASGVTGGMPYIGSSAGSNIAGPNILTTNDWNVCASTKFDALQLVPFNINPHYFEADPASAPFAETRADRIAEFHAEFDHPVVGIEEQTWVKCVDGRYEVGGQGRVHVFLPGREATIHQPGQALSF